MRKSPLPADGKKGNRDERAEIVEKEKIRIVKSMKLCCDEAVMTPWGAKEGNRMEFWRIFSPDRASGLAGHQRRLRRVLCFLRYVQGGKQQHQTAAGALSYGELHGVSGFCHCAAVPVEDVEPLMDVLRFNQIIFNLLSNAVKYTPEGGAVSFSVYDEPVSGHRERITPVVKDNGVGMSEAFQKALFAFDTVLMDIHMPVMNGLDVARAIRKMDRPDAETVPIYAMTADAFGDDVKKRRETGMKGRIAKPFSPDFLFETLLRGVPQQKKTHKKSRPPTGGRLAKTAYSAPSAEEIVSSI